MEKVATLRAERAKSFDALTALAELDKLTPAQIKEFGELETAVKGYDSQIERVKTQQELAAKSAVPVIGQVVAAEARKHDAYIDDDAAKARGLGTHKGLIIAATAKMMALGNNNMQLARMAAVEVYGENHPVTKALLTGVGSAGGFLVPPDQMNEIIELLRPMTVVRQSNPRTIPMPRGTMTLPSQTAPATATYGSEGSAITSSQQTFGDIVASFKKLTALVPVSNDMLRYADPAIDAVVRDDLVEVIALREDLAFMLGDGTQSSPRGWTSFANSWATAQGGTAGTWSSTADSVAAVNGTVGSSLQGLNGGNFVTSTETYTLATVAAELGGLVNKLDSANVGGKNRRWFMNPRSYNYLYNVQNSLGLYVYRDELSKGTLLGYEVMRSTQIPTNIWDTTGANKDCSFVFLAELPESMILDSMQLELAVSREGSYLDASGNSQSAFSRDLTLIRAIAEHDFQMRHLSGVAVDQFVRWAPAIS